MTRQETRQTIHDIEKDAVYDNICSLPGINVQVMNLRLKRQVAVADIKVSFPVPIVRFKDKTQKVWRNVEYPLNKIEQYY